MIRVYNVIYISSEDGDVEHYRKVYKSFSQAADDLDNVIQDYIKEKCIDNRTRVMTEDVTISELLRDKKFPVNHYHIKKNASNAIIYKKMVVPGMLVNGAKVERVGKIGISEIRIPVKEPVKRPPTRIPRKGKIEDNDMFEESDESFEVVTAVAATNYEHGQHVSFIHELKSVLDQRNAKVIKVDVERAKVEPHPDHVKFLTSLSDTKRGLKHVTPPTPRKFFVEEYLREKGLK